MPDDPLKVEDKGAARKLTINRPDRLNALNSRIFDRLEEELFAARGESSVRVLVVAGAGEKSFSAGADLDELADKSPVGAKVLLERGQSVLDTLEDLGKPVIAAVDGYALGGGLELALSCSFILGSTRAKLGLPEVGLGLIPGYGGTQRLSRLVGRGAALRMMLSGERIGSEEAASIGLLAAPPLEAEGFDAAVMEQAMAIAEKSPVAQHLILSAVSAQGRIDTGLSYEASLAGLATTTEDGREGIAAFREKRKPRFTGRMA